MARMVSALPALLLAVLALAGCSGGGGDGSASAWVKDAATDEFDEVHLVITEVSIHQSGGNDSAGWKVLFSGSEDVDLLNTTGARAAFLGETDLAPGKYQQVRIKASSAYGMKDGNRIEIGLPQKDLKVVKGFKVEADAETQIILDIDLDKSLTQKQGSWEFKPTIGKAYAVKQPKGHSEDKDEGAVETVQLTDTAAA